MYFDIIIYFLLLLYSSWRMNFIDLEICITLQTLCIALTNIVFLRIGEIAIYNLFYELFSVCTSIVAEDPSGRS